MDTSDFLGLVASAFWTVGLRLVWVLVMINLANQLGLLVGEALKFRPSRDADWSHGAREEREKSPRMDVGSILRTRRDVSVWMPDGGRGQHI